MNQTALFKSSLSDDIQKFLNMKRALGYKYDDEEYILRLFDTYWIQHNGESQSATMDSLAEWVKQRPTEGKSFQYARVQLVKQLMEFRNSRGKLSYVPMDKIKCPKHPVIHVLNRDEIQALFQGIDAFRPTRPTSETLRISKEYPAALRLIASTGLRRSEAASILIQDIDFSCHIIMIRNAKGHKDRIISISEDMSDLLKNYLCFLENAVQGQIKWLFPSINPIEHLNSASLESIFNRAWMQTTYASTCAKKPTVHSLRHSFVVSRINSWIEQGIDTRVMMPYLSHHLGHKSPDETFYYYHQVQESLKAIHQMDQTSEAVIPEVRCR